MKLVPFKQIDCFFFYTSVSLICVKTLHIKYSRCVIYTIVVQSLYEKSLGGRNGQVFQLSCVFHFNTDGQVM